MGDVERLFHLYLSGAYQQEIRPLKITRSESIILCLRPEQSRQLHASIL